MSNKAAAATVVITIDGPAGAGKSTVARALAQHLRFSYLDTGAMYRALTLKALRKKINLEDESALVKLAQVTTIDLKADAARSLRVYLDGEDVTSEIRSLEVTNNTFYIARTPGVREIVVEWQRTIGCQQSIVAEGRDVGTVVFPQARHKFYMDADFEVRCRRRIEELKAQGKKFDEEGLKAELKERDQKDLTRKVGPLRRAPDAIFIDSTRLTVDQTVEKILAHVKRHG